jgi:hypothetical protein
MLDPNYDSKGENVELTLSELAIKRKIGKRSLYSHFKEACKAVIIDQSAKASCTVNKFSHTKLSYISQSR